jgi:hypothetical protein
MDYLDQRHGRFVTVLPRSRSEDGEFRKWLSMSKIVKRGDNIYAYVTEAEGREALHRHLRDWTGRFSGSLQKLPNDIVGVVFHVITPAVDRMANMYVSAQHTQHPSAGAGRFPGSASVSHPGRALEVER